MQPQGEGRSPCGGGGWGKSRVSSVKVNPQPVPATGQREGELHLFPENNEPSKTQKEDGAAVPGWRLE